MPSVTDLLFITLLLGLSCGALGRLLLRDADTGWHIRNGEQILLMRTVPRTDAFSSTMGGQPWYAWEWLCDLLLGAVHRTLGLNGVVFYAAAIIASTFVLTCHLALRRGANLMVTLFLLVLVLGASAVHFLARPHLVSWLFSVIWFEVLDSATSASRAKESRRLYWLPVLMLFWVNLHGGFLFGFILLTLYLAAALFERFFGHPDGSASVRPLVVVSLLSLLASFVNPYGYKLHVHIYRYLSDRFLMNRISEFLSPNFHNAAQQCFAILLLIAIVALASARRRPRFAQLLVVLACAYSGLYATRNLPVSSFLILLVIAPILSEAIAHAAQEEAVLPWLRRLFGGVQGFGTRMGALESQFRGHVWLVAGFAMGLWACAHGGKLGGTRLIDAYFDAKKYPVEAAGMIARQNLAEPIFSLDYWGGYLIYRLYPQSKVVVDDRHDLYGDEFFKDYLKVTLVQPDWQKVLDDRRVNWVLVPVGSSLANVMAMTPNWKALHEDRTAVLFHRGS